MSNSRAVRIALAAGLILSASGIAATKIQVQGHRGARAMRPENTLPAFNYAIDAGVDVLELDMAVTKDNIVVVSHDPILEPPVCSGPEASAVIHTLTLQQVKQWDCGKVRNPRFPEQKVIAGTRMPTLDEVFELAPRGNFDFNIETKIFADHPEYTPSPEEFCQLVLDQVRKHKLESRVILQSFDSRTLVAMKSMAPEIRLSALIEQAQDWVDTARQAKAGIISPLFTLVTAEQVQAAHQAGLQVVPWTANEPKDWELLIAAGVDGIISDDPAALMAYLKAKKLR